MYKRQEETKAEAANGNGPVDAIYQAINRITGYDVELVKYDLNAKGQGKDCLLYTSHCFTIPR